MAFAKLGLSPWLLKVVKEMGYANPRAIQEQCIPAVLAGRDVLGSSETGSGKTAAFALPILQRLAEDPVAMFTLVLTPTRELATQITEQMSAFGTPISLRISLIVGGRDMMKQALELTQKPHAIVATPGRLADHLQSTNTIKLNRIQYLVLDEADRLLDGGYDKELEVIFQAVPSDCRKLLFSATMPPEKRTLMEAKVERMSKRALSNPFRFDANDKPTTVATLKQEYLFMPANVKQCYLVYLLRQFAGKSAIVFAGKCRTAALLHVMLSKLEIDAVSLHSELSQELRTKSLEKFKSQLSKVLIATDVASRGLDIPEVEVVINFDVAMCPDDYIHRVGRTARAGRGGLALSLLSPEDIEKLHAIEGATGVKLQEHTVKEDTVLQHLNEARIAERIAEMFLEETGFGEKRRINKRKKLQLEGKLPRKPWDRRDFKKVAREKPKEPRGGGASDQK